MASIAMTNNVVSNVLPKMLMSKICQSKNENASNMKNAKQYTNTEKRMYLTKELHSITLREGSKTSLPSLGANIFNNQGVTSHNKHMAPAAMPGVLVNMSTPKPNKKPVSTYTQREVSLGRMSRK